MSDRSGTDRSAGDATASDDSPNGISRLFATTPRTLGALVLAVVALLVAAYFLGIVGAPSAGLEDRGDWGTVTEERTGVVTTVWVDNPNPFPVPLGDGLSADYELAFNDVALARGGTEGVQIPSGNSTVALHTDIRNDRLPAWWVAFVRANETVTVDVDGTLSVDVGPTISHQFHREETVMADATPIVTALSTAANGTSGTYTRSVSTDLVGGIDGNREVTVGYEIREGSARWAEVTEAETTAVFEFTVHNPGDVPVPAVPDGLGVAVDMNDVRTFEGDSGALSARSVSPDTLIAPGETRTVQLTVRMDNEKVDEWFTSHVRRGERTAVSAGLQLVFEVPATGSTIRVPRDSPVTYDCEFETAILVDEGTTRTDCGDPGAVARVDRTT